MKALYGVLISLQGGWLQHDGHDFVTESPEGATDVAKSAAGVAAPYYRGHAFPDGTCLHCRVSFPSTRWCPHANNRTVEVADMARRLWDTDDRVASLVVEIHGSTEPSDELLDRLYMKDAGGLRSDAEGLAERCIP